MARETNFHRDPVDGLWRPVGDKARIIRTLPDPSARALAEKMGKNLKLTEDAEVIYPDATTTPGSPLSLLMNWYLNRRTVKEKPLDAEEFVRLIERSVPPRWVKLYGGGGGGDKRKKN